MLLFMLSSFELESNRAQPNHEDLVPNALELIFGAEGNRYPAARKQADRLPVTREISACSDRQ
jgi:hypothetical protein